MATRELKIDNRQYPVLGRFSSEMGLGKVIDIDNRDDKVNELRAAMARPVISNAMLLAEAGTGKIAIV